VTATSEPTVSTAHPPASPEPRRSVNWPKLTFLGVLLIAFAVYTEIAMGMEWRTAAGRIGPGFFPRILGLTAIAFTVVAGVREILVRPGVTDVDEVEAAEDAAEPDLGRHPLALVAFIASATVFVALFGVLGAALAAVLFLGVTLWFLDPKHHIRAVIIAIAVPVLLYLAFQTGLDAGLPEGILPLN
jgi:putative tricarboxylic transport membrane protein